MRYEHEIDWGALDVRTLTLEQRAAIKRYAIARAHAERSEMLRVMVQAAFSWLRTAAGPGPAKRPPILRANAQPQIRM